MFDGVVEGVIEYISGNVEMLLGSAVLWLVNILITLLPSTPFLISGADGIPAESIRWLNWFVDVGGLANIMAGWLLCVSLYYVASKVYQVISNINGIRFAIGERVVDAVSGGGGE